MANSNSIRVRGITIEIRADMTGLVDSFKTADSQVRRLQSNLNALTSYIARDNTFTGLKNKWSALALQQEMIGTETDRLKTKIEAEKKALLELERADPTDKQVERMQALRTQIILDTEELQKLEKQAKSFGELWQQKWVAVGDAVEEAGRKLTGFGTELTSTGRSLSMYVTAPIIGIGTAAAKSSMDFESAMDKVQSVTLDATTEDMEALTAAVLELSGKSKYSATEAADALYYMGLAGWDTNKMLKALPHVLAVATAGEMDLGRASDIVTDYFTAFGEGAGTVENMVDVMARTMVSSNTDIDQLGDAFKYVAPVAGAMGYSIEDVSFALGLMANNGIKASQAGTSLRQFMQRLVKPTAEVEGAMNELGLTVANSDGSMKSFREVMDELREALGGVFDPTGEAARQIGLLDQALEEGEISEEQYNEALMEVISSTEGVTGAEKAKDAAILAGVRGMSGLLAIVNATEEDYETLAAAIQGTTTAQDIANIMLDNTKGRMEILKHSAQNLGISFGEQLLPYVQSGIEKAQSLIEKFSALDDGTKDLIIQVAGIAAAVGPALVVAGSVISSIGSIATGVGGLIKLVAKHPILAAVTALAAGIGILVVKTNAAKKAEAAERKELWGLNKEYEALVDEVNSSKKAYDEETKARDQTSLAIDTEIGHLENLQTELSSIVDENGRVKEGYEARAQVIVDELNEALGTEIELNDHIIINYKDISSELTKLIDKKRQEYILEEGERKYKKAIQESQAAYEQYTEAAMAHEAQVEKVSEAKQRLTDYEKKYIGMSSDARAEILAHDKEYQKLLADYNEADAAEKVLQATMNDSKAVYNRTQNDIKNYGDALEAVATGDTELAREALNKLLYDFQRFDTSTEAQLRSQVTKYNQLYTQAQRDVAAGVAGVSQATVDGYKQMVVLAEKELERYKQTVGNTGKTTNEAAKKAGAAMAENYKAGINSVHLSGPGSDFMEEFIEGVKKMTPEVRMAAAAAAQAAQEEMNKADGYSGGKNFSLGVSSGIKDYIYTIEEAANEAASAGKRGFNKPIAIYSPSRVMMKSGKYFDEGIAIGIRRNADEVVAEAETLSNDLAATMNYNTTSPNYAAMHGATSSRTWNLGGVSITINQQPGENAQELAEMVMERMEMEITQRQMVMAV